MLEDVVGFTLVIGIVLIIVLSAISSIRNRRKHSHSVAPTPIYGAWQGHELGTTMMEPGDLTKLENEIGSGHSNEDE